jgi:hypothetical protein
LRAFTPFFTAEERREAGCQHRLFFAQIEYCDTLIFQRRAARDQLGARLLDANRTIGQPDSITTIFGRRVMTHHHGKLQTCIHDFHLPHPVIRSHYGHGFVKQYVRDHLLLRTEPATNDVGDYGIRKAVEHLPALRQRLAGIVDHYLDVQQDILEPFVDRGQLRRLAEPTVLASGKRLVSSRATPSWFLRPVCSEGSERSRADRTSCRETGRLEPQHSRVRRRGRPLRRLPQRPPTRRMTSTWRTSEPQYYFRSVPVAIRTPFAHGGSSDGTRPAGGASKLLTVSGW